MPDHWATDPRAGLGRFGSDKGRTGPGRLVTFDAFLGTMPNRYFTTIFKDSFQGPFSGRKHTSTYTHVRTHFISSGVVFMVKAYCNSVVYVCV